MSSGYTYTGVNKDGTSFEFPEEYFSELSEREIIEIYPLIERVICVELGLEVWTRTMAYFPGDYDPGMWTPKK